MKILLDSHAFFWWLIDHPRLSRNARTAIEDRNNEILASAVVAWELATKVRLGKWDDAKKIAETFDRVVASEGFQPLSISPEHARVAGFYPSFHGDPFDRILAAQSQIEQALLITADPAFREFGTQTIW